MLYGPTLRDPMRLVDPRHLPQLMSLEDHEPTMVGGTMGPHNSTPVGEEGAPGQQHHSFPWAVTLLAGVLITTIVVDVIGNLLVIVSVFRNKKLRKAGIPERLEVENRMNRSPFLIILLSTSSFI
nr:PREDICTED: melatonin receptor type 1A-like [Paralichthys olivaceus]